MQASAEPAEHSQQIARVLGITPLIRNLRLLQLERACGAPAGPQELILRQELLETVLASSLDGDGVLAEIDNERARLFELRDRLQARRDRAVGLTNVANLITGTGVGIAVNAMQFSNSTADLGDGIGVGSGIASTVLSIVGIHLQRGPQQSIGRIPNMLARLFNEEPALNSDYPPEVLLYLRTVPPGESPARGSRLDQLMAEWVRAGRIARPGTPKSERKIKLLTTSMNTRVKVSIGDLSDRGLMLDDVGGVVGLMKRDLADLMRSLPMDQTNCKP